MRRIQSALFSRKAKMSGTTMLLIAIVALVVIGGGVSIPKVDLTKFNPFGGGSAGTTTVPVNRPIDFALTDQYAGSALTSKTLVVYDSDGATPLETLTTGADGTIATGFNYESGKKIYVYYESSNDKQWFPVTVPEMNEKDAEALTVNPVALKSFTIGTYTSDALKHGATTISDAGSYNKTTSGNTKTFTYSLANTGSDNTGLVSSYDPIYQMKYEPVIYVTLSGTNYEKVIVYGFDWDFTLGTTHYVAQEVDAYSLTLHKVGNEYKSTGTYDLSFTLDMTGYSGDSATVQITVYAYSDPQYAMNHGGSAGPESVEIAEHTFTLQD